MKKKKKYITLLAFNFWKKVRYCAEESSRTYLHNQDILYELKKKKKKIRHSEKGKNDSDVISNIENDDSNNSGHVKCSLCMVSV